MVDNIWLLRHGLRLDYEEPDWERDNLPGHDTPLSRKGRIQAEETADYLIKEKENIQHVFSSPFYRTMETADIIAGKIDLKVKVEYGFCEFLNPDWFDEFPELLSLDNAADRFSTIDTDYRSMIRPEYPEHNENIETYQRIGQTMDKIINKFRGTILIIGHGASVWQSGRYLIQKNPDDMQGKMCVLNKFTREGELWKFEKTVSDHLSYTEADLEK
ncbi:MAG: histidine phosphatase family protein [Bacillota bacterium]